MASAKWDGMPTCPRCHKHFRVLEDEDDGQHDCPCCGYSSHQDECLWCSQPCKDEDCYPYCSEECGIAAALDSEEDEA